MTQRSHVAYSGASAHCDVSLQFLRPPPPPALPATICFMPCNAHCHHLDPCPLSARILQQEALANDPTKQSEADKVLAQAGSMLNRAKAQLAEKQGRIPPDVFYDSNGKVRLRTRSTITSSGSSRIIVSEAADDAASVTPQPPSPRRDGQSPQGPPLNGSPHYYQEDSGPSASPGSPASSPGADGSSSPRRADPNGHPQRSGDDPVPFRVTHLVGRNRPNGPLAATLAGRGQDRETSSEDRAQQDSGGASVTSRRGAARRAYCVTRRHALGLVSCAVRSVLGSCHSGEGRSHHRPAEGQCHEGRWQCLGQKDRRWSGRISQA